MFLWFKETFFSVFTQVSPFFILNVRCYQSHITLNFTIAPYTTLICLPKSKINDIVNGLNNIHPKLLFTLEKSLDDSINFLDLNIKIDNDEIITNGYRKLVCSGRFLNFYSNHSFSNRIGVIYSSIDRAILLSHERYHDENLKLVEETLLKNGYPLDLLLKKISKRYKCLILNKTSNVILKYNIETKDLKKLITLPYIDNFQEQFYRIWKKSNLLIVFTLDNTIQQKIFKSVKIPTPFKLKDDIVYDLW